TADSWAVLEDALADAKAVVADTNATQQEVDDAKAALESAIDELVAVTVVDKTALTTAIAKAEALTEADYTAESWTALKDALADAKAVAADANATQQAVDIAKATLENAVKDLVKVDESKTDSSKLETVIKDSDKLKETDYTKDSWAGYVDALNKAKDVLSNDNATQAEIDAAHDNLLKAINNLVAVDGNTELPNIDVEKPNNNNGGSNTGDSTNVVGLMALLGLSGLAIVLGMKKRKKV
ncbi:MULTISPECIES: LPXTG cell wall anchor domain-containing protein, partial [unclassified Breznakia]